MFNRTAGSNRIGVSERVQSYAGMLEVHWFRYWFCWTSTLLLRQLILSQGQVTGMKLVHVRFLRLIRNSTGFCTGTAPVQSNVRTSLKNSVFFTQTRLGWLVLGLNSSETTLGRADLRNS